MLSGNYGRYFRRINRKKNGGKYAGWRLRAAALFETAACAGSIQRRREGIKLLSIFEVDDANIKDGIVKLPNAAAINAIQGFRFEIETMMPRQFRH